MNVQVHLGENLALGVAVSEAYVAQLNVAGDVLDGRRVRVVLNFRLHVHNFIEAFHAGKPLHKGFGELGKAAYGVEQYRGVEKVRHVVARGYLPVHQEHRAKSDHGDIHNAVKQSDYAVQLAEGAVRLALDSEENLVALLELLLFHFFVGKALHNADTQKAVFNLCVDFAYLGTFAVKIRPQLVSELEHEPPEHGNHNVHEQRQRNVDVEQYKQRGYELHNTDEDFLRGVVAKFRHVKEILGKAAHKLPHLGVAVKAEAHFLQMGEQVAAHIRFELCTHHVTYVRHKVVRRSVDYAQHDIYRADFQNEIEGEGSGVLLCGVRYTANDYRQNNVAHRGEGSAEQIQKQRGQIRLVVGQKPLYIVLLLWLLGFFTHFPFYLRK